MNNKILVIGDPHFRPRLGYADQIKDGRESEKKEVLDFIVEQAKDVQKVVLMGDCLNSRTNPPSVIKDFTNFVERFDNKEVFIISGNHTKFGDGRTAIDYLKEIKGKNWYIITNTVEAFDGLVFTPFFTKSELETNDNDKARDEIMKRLLPGKILFVHHAIGGSMVGSKYPVDAFPEPILPRSALEKKYQLVIGSHIHSAQQKNRTIVTGSLMTQEVGETEKFIWKINEDTFEHEQIKLPCRPIYKLEITDKLPTKEEWEEYDTNGIIKVIIKAKRTEAEIKELKTMLSRFAAFIFLEQIPHERKKLHIGEGEGLLEWDIDKLLEVYAKERKVSLDLLNKGFELVRT